MSRYALALSFTALVLAACSPDTAGEPLAPSAANDLRIASSSWAPAASIEGTVLLITRDAAFSHVPGGLKLDDWTK